MIAPNPEQAPKRGGRPRVHPRNAATLRRLCRRIDELGSIYIAAPLCGLTKAWVQDWAAEDARVSVALERAAARFVARSVRRLQYETDPVLAMSHRFIAARRCPDFREEKSRAEKVLEKTVRSLVRFERAVRPEAAATRG